MLILSDDQRKVLKEEYGAPVPVIDAESAKGYVLLPVDFSPTEPDGVRAALRGIRAIGEGEEPYDALLALCAAIQGLTDADVGPDGFAST